MICKNCGRALEQKQRFCPYCGSYFIDAESEDDGLEWKGIIHPDGTVERTVKVTAANGYVPQGAGNKKVWGILAVASAGLALLLNILSFMTDAAIFVLGVPNFVFAIIACTKAGAGKLRGSAMLILMFCVFTFLAAVNIIS